MLKQAWIFSLFALSLGSKANQTTQENALDQVISRSSEVDNSLVLLEIVYLRRDLRKSEENILERLGKLETSIEDTENKKENYKEQIQSLENELSNLNEQFTKLNEAIESQNVDILELQRAIDNGRNNLTAAKSHLMTALNNFEMEEDAKSEAIVNNVCKARSIAMPNGCNTAECCLKSAFEKHDKCLRSCSSGQTGSGNTNVKRCPGGYSLYNEGNFCYKFHKSCTDWSTARATCRREGGDLIMLKTSKAVTFFRAITTANYGGCMRHGPWIGGSDHVKEGDWRWIDGSRVQNYWNPGEPNGGRSENYLHLHSKTYYFNDAPHNFGGVNFICAVQ